MVIQRAGNHLSHVDFGGRIRKGDGYVYIPIKNKCVTSCFVRQIRPKTEETDRLQIILDKIFGDDFSVGSFLIYPLRQGGNPAFDGMIQLVEGDVRNVDDLKRVLYIPLLHNPIGSAVFYERGVAGMEVFLIGEIRDVDGDLDHLLLAIGTVRAVGTTAPVLFNLVSVGKIKKVIPKVVE